MEWEIVTKNTTVVNASTLVELSLYCINTLSEEISLPNLKRLTIFYDSDNDWQKVPQINFNCLTKLETLILSYFIVNCLKLNKNLKVLKLGEKLLNANDCAMIAEQLFTEDLPFKLKELILDDWVHHENFTKFLAVQLNTLKVKVEEIAMVFNNSKIIDLCLQSFFDWFSDREKEKNCLEQLKTLTKPNKHIHKLYLDAFDNYEIINFLSLQAPNVRTIDIYQLDQNIVELFAKNLMHLRVLNTHDDDRGYYKGEDYDVDDDEIAINPIKHYKNIIAMSENVNFNKEKQKNLDKDLRFGNEYSLNIPWRHWIQIMCKCVTS